MVPATGIGMVNADWLNLRVSPGGRILTVLKGGSEVQVVGRMQGWLEVWYGELRGSVASTYITMSPQIAPPPSEIETSDLPMAESERSDQVRRGEITASQLNMRDAPKGHILTRLPRATMVNILSEANGWMKVHARGRTGYVASKYIRLSSVTRTIFANPAESHTVTTGFRFDGDKAIGPDGNQFAKKFRKGVFSSGRTSISEFVQEHKDSISTISASQLRLMDAVSQNEGKLEAINTWDNAFLSFGIFQWTAGVGAEAGELPALLDRLQQRFPETYGKYFGRYALDVSGVRALSGSPARGYLKLKGQVLGNAEQKQVLRSLAWPYRCKQAGFDDEVRLVQLEHALARVDCFWKVNKRRIRGHFIGDYVTSEYGVAQLLDQHVNRPAHVFSTVSKSVEALANDIDVDRPQNWGDKEERQLLQTYLKFRAQTSMTDGKKRAKRILNKLHSGVISDERGSYQ